MHAGGGGAALQTMALSAARVQHWVYSAKVTTAQRLVVRHSSTASSEHVRGSGRHSQTRHPLLSAANPFAHARRQVTGSHDPRDDDVVPELLVVAELLLAWEPLLLEPVLEVPVAPGVVPGPQARPRETSAYKGSKCRH
jgi:hypothetical protein